VSRYQKGKTNLDFTEARYSEWQWNLLDHMQVCTSLQTDNHASTPLSFLQARCNNAQQSTDCDSLHKQYKGELFANISHKQIIIIISRALQLL